MASIRSGAVLNANMHRVSRRLLLRRRGGSSLVDRSQWAANGTSTATPFQLCARSASSLVANETNFQPNGANDSTITLLDSCQTIQDLQSTLLAHPDLPILHVLKAYLRLGDAAASYSHLRATSQPLTSACFATVIEGLDQNRLVWQVWYEYQDWRAKDEQMWCEGVLHAALPKDGTAFWDDWVRRGGPLTLKSYNLYLGLLADQGEVRRIQALLREMEASGTMPDIVSHNALLKACSRSDAPKTTEWMEEYIAKLWKEGPEPNTISYHRLLYSYSRHTTWKGAPQRADRVYRDMLRRGIPVDEPCFVALMTTCNRASDSAKVEAYYEDMLRMGLRPSSFVYNALLAARKHDAVRNTEILDLMVAEYQAGQESAQPTTESIHKVLASWLTSDDPLAPVKAEALLKRMRDLHEKYQWRGKLNNQCYLAVIDCWTLSKHPDAPRRAEAILRTTIDLYEAGDTSLRPTNMAYTKVMKAWLMSGSSSVPHQVDRLYREMLVRSQKGDTVLRPNRAAYKLVLDAWLQDHRPDGATRAYAFLEEVGDLHRMDPQYEAPSANHYAPVLERIGENDAEEASRILREMRKSKQWQPNERCYNAVIRAISRSSMPDAEAQVRSLLRLMHQDASQGQPCTPSANTFSHLFSLWKDDPDSIGKATDLLRTLLAQADFGQLKANVSIFLAFLRGTEDAHYLRPLLQLMDRYGVDPAHPAIRREVDRLSRNDVADKVKG